MGLTSQIRTHIRRPHPGGGFTLVELVAVIIILGVLAITAAPALSSMTRTRGTLAAKQLLRDLTFARQRAVATGTRTWVVFNTAADTWTILGENPASPGRAGATVLTDMATNAPFVVTLNTGSFVGIEIASAAFAGGAEVGFDWLGIPYGSTETVMVGLGSVTLTGNHVVNVQRNTGLATYVPP